ncbi:MAG: hypothetical protein AB1724_15915 [Thermodesulfobacteriota bacterium]
MTDFSDERDFDFSFGGNKGPGRKEPDRDDAFGRPDEDDDRDDAFVKSVKAHEREYAREDEASDGEGLDWKFILPAILIPCLIVGVMVVAYISLSRKVAAVQSTGSAAVEEFVHIYDAKLGEIQKTLTAQDEAVRGIQDKLSGVAQNAAAIKEIHAGVKTLTGADGKMAAAIESMNKEVDKLTAAVGETSRQVLALGQKIETAETKVSSLAAAAAGKADAEAVRRMVADAEKKLQASIDASAKAIKSDVKALDTRVGRVEQQRTKAAPSTSTGTAPARKPATGSTSPPAGDQDFIEEDL